MKSIESWGKEDYYTYFLIYVAYADFKVVEEEREYILQRVSKEEYKKILKVFVKHSDVEKISMFDNFLTNFCKTQTEKLNIFKEMKDLFNIDGRFDSCERMFFMHFKKLIFENNMTAV